MASITTLTLPKTIFNRTLYNSVLSLWFDPLKATDTKPLPENFSKWFTINTRKEDTEKFDQSCHESVSHALEILGPSKISLPSISSCKEEREGAAALAAPFGRAVAEEPDENSRVDAALSLVLLLDQMPRNIYRKDQGVIYSHFDRMSRAIMYCMKGLATSASAQQSEVSVLKGLDIAPRYRANLAHRMWFYLPFEHSEYLEDHDEYDQSMLDLIEATRQAGDAESLVMGESSKDYAKKHRVILEQFGRYPYRNKWLGRQTTAEEQKWIDDGGDTFGS